MSGVFPFALLDGPAAYHDSSRIRALARFTRRSETVGAGKPDNVTFTLGQLIRESFQEALRRSGANLAIDGGAGGACGRP